MSVSEIKDAANGHVADYVARYILSGQVNTTQQTRPNQNLDELVSGNSYFVTNATNIPSDVSSNGRLYVIQTVAGNYHNIFQVYFPEFGNVSWRRRSWSSSASAFIWGSWHILT